MSDTVKILTMIAVFCGGLVAICFIIVAGLWLQMKVLEWCDEADDWLYNRRNKKLVK